MKTKNDTYITHFLRANMVIIMKQRPHKFRASRLK